MEGLLLDKDQSASLQRLSGRILVQMMCDYGSWVLKPPLQTAHDQCSEYKYELNNSAKVETSSFAPISKKHDQWKTPLEDYKTQTMVNCNQSVAAIC